MSITALNQSLNEPLTHCTRQRLWWLCALIFIGLVVLISSNSAQWVFLARVQWVALLGLTILPLLAHTSGRGVSGGSVGIMYFVTACKLEGFLSKERSGNDRSISILKGVADVTKSSSLSEAIRGLAYTDFIRAVAPFFLTDVYRDRAEGLERAWVSNAKELNSSYSEILKGATLRGWQKDVARGELPGDF